MVLVAALAVGTFLTHGWLTAPNQPAAPAIPASGRSLGNSIGMQLVEIPAGKFLMGSVPQERDRVHLEVQHEVEITRSFYLGIHEVTQGQYEQVVGTNPSRFKVTPTHPVENVSFEDALAFCSQLSQRAQEVLAGRAYRLPTEAEWEHACRGGSAVYAAFHFGNQLNSTQANFDGSYPYGNAVPGPFRQQTLPVASFAPNAYGLYDMHGNVWEWCTDWYGVYDLNDTRDPQGPPNGKQRILRGGSWHSRADNCRSASRYADWPIVRSDAVGFRVVCEVKAKPP